MQRIDVITIGEPAPVEKALEAPRDARADADDLLVVGRRQRSKARTLRIRRVVEAVEREQVEVHVEVQGVAEAEHERRRVRAGMRSRHCTRRAPAPPKKTRGLRDDRLHG